MDVHCESELCDSDCIIVHIEVRRPRESECDSDCVKYPYWDNFQKESEFDSDRVRVHI